MKNDGFIALTSVLIIGALVLLIGVGVSLRAVEEIDISLSQESAHKALSLANLCAEHALMKLESVLEYNGNETITLGAESCDILEIEGSGNFTRTVKTQSTVLGHVQRVRVEVSEISPEMKITSWSQVSDF